MDIKALFTISHGVYVTGAVASDGRPVGSCVDAVMVVEADPAYIMVSMGRGSYTREVVHETRKMSLSVLGADVSDEVIRCFGMQSSRSVDKWQGQPHHLLGGLPVLSDAVVCMTLEVTEIIETATHEVMLCRVVEIERGSMLKPLIYQDYQNRKENKMSDTKKWVCPVCGYVYDGEVPFEELPDNWVCPLCGEPKSIFVQE